MRGWAKIIYKRYPRFTEGAHTLTDWGFGGRSLKSVNHGCLRRAEHVFKVPLRLLESQDPTEDYEKRDANSVMKTVVFTFYHPLP